MPNLQDIENQIKKIADEDVRSWVRISDLMMEVDNNKLYKERQLQSFNQWVNTISGEINIHVSYLWKCLKAGKFYKKISQSIKDKVIPMDQLNCSVDTLILCEKISAGDDKIATNLVEKVINKELRRTDLKNAWSEKKALKGDAIIRKTKHDQEQVLINSKASPLQRTIEDVLNDTDVINEKTIKDALRDSSLWIIAPSDVSSKHSRFVKRTYKTFNEFPVQIDTSSARRIDTLVIENITTNSNYEIHSHCVEIKIEKSDLIQDRKMEEYSKYTNYMWIACTQELVEDAINYAKETWGILVISEDKSIRVVRDAKFNDNALNDILLATEFIKNK